jgi:hypothetical protein
MATPSVHLAVLPSGAHFLFVGCEWMGVHVVLKQTKSGNTLVKATSKKERSFSALDRHTGELKQVVFLAPAGDVFVVSAASLVAAQ